MRKFLDKFSLYWDFTNGAGSLGKAHPVKPVVRDLQGDFASVVRNSPKNLTQKTGLIGSIPANTIPYRWDGNRFGAFVEPSAVNLFFHSEAFNEGYWTKTNATLTQNVAIAPDGAMTADLLETSTTFGRIVRTFDFLTLPNNQPVTISIFVKSGTTNSFRIIGRDKNNNALGANFNVDTLSTNTVTAGVTPLIEVHKDDWIRCSITYSVGTGSTASSECRLVQILSPNSTEVTAGSAGDNLFIWGAQLETGSVATSYIKTEGSTQTRNADVITLSNIPDLIGQTQGFIYAEVNTRNLGTTANPRRAFSIEGSTDTNSAMLNVTTAGTLETVFGGVTRSVGTTSANNGLQKWCILYYNGGFKTFRNGVLVDTYVGAWTNPSWDRFAVGRSVATASREFNDTIYRVGIGKEILSDEEAIFMTTL
jgi:hypothetical protein